MSVIYSNKKETRLKYIAYLNFRFTNHSILPLQILIIWKMVLITLFLLPMTIFAAPSPHPKVCLFLPYFIFFFIFCNGYGHENKPKPKSKSKLK